MKLEARIAKVKVSHILAVIHEIRTGDVPVPPRREAKRWKLWMSRQPYPTKYVLGRAIELATPDEDDVLPSHYSGGKFTLNALKKILGTDSRFKIR
jgi:hypothetical protein